MKRKIAVCAVLATGLYASLSIARGVTPVGGRAYFATDAGCFTNSWNWLTNSCAGYKKFMFDAPTDTSNNYHTVQMYGRGTGSIVVKCWATSNTANGVSGWSVYGDRAVTSWGPLSMAAGSVWVPSGGQLHGDCDVPQTGGISAFHYSP